MGRPMRSERGSTSSVANVATCCIPQANLMKIMGISSSVFGAPITLVSTILTYSPDITESLSNDDNTVIFLKTAPFKILMFVGAIQTICSVWLLWARDKRRAAKFWTIGHFLSFCGTLMYLWNLLSSKPVTNRCLRLYFYFVGVNFCAILFMTLVMIELLLRPMSSDNDHMLVRRDSNATTASMRSKDSFEYKV